MNKACPIVLRNHNREILAFKHPLSGKQIVKGGIEEGGSLQQACVRELKEESGLDAQAIMQLPDICLEAGQHWGFYTMKCISTLKETWVHYTHDGGGLEFRFFWQSLYENPDETWHPIYIHAIHHIRQALAK